MSYGNLFPWWEVVITAGIMFLTAISVYLYCISPKMKDRREKPAKRAYRVVVDFIFVWVLLNLLALYIISIGSVSSVLFAIGNIIVEAVLLVYLTKNKTREA